MLSKAQLEERKHYIGSSEAATIASGDIEQWIELSEIKNGNVTKAFTKQQRFLMDTGSYLEEYILDKWCIDQKKTLSSRGMGKSVMMQPRNIRDSVVPLHSTFDAIMGTVPIEIKAHFGFRDIDELAELYAPQCQHHMIVSGMDHCYLVAFFGVRCRIEFRQIKKDYAWCDQYINQAAEFWDLHMTDRMQDALPAALRPVDWSDMITINMTELEGFSQADQKEFNMKAGFIQDAKDLESIATKSKDDFKAKMPKNCKRMDFDCDGNMTGHKVRVTRSKAGTLTCTFIPPKKDKDNE